MGIVSALPKGKPLKEIKLNMVMNIQVASVVFPTFLFVLKRAGLALVLPNSSFQSNLKQFFRKIR